jgi:hypothetical protein
MLLLPTEVLQAPLLFNLQSKIPTLSVLSTFSAPSLPAITNHGTRLPRGTAKGLLAFPFNFQLSTVNLPGGVVLFSLF